MLTILAFLLTIAGSVNWLLIGLLQYDFVAGIFGFQASIFSRIIYIIIGASSIVLIVKLFKSKGTIPVFSRRNKKDLEKNIEKIQTPKQEKVMNVESSREFDRQNSYYEPRSYHNDHSQTSIFDEDE